MTDFVLNFVTSTAQTLAGESGFITANGGVIVNGADAITTTTGTNVITNDGYIYAYNSSSSAIDADGSSLYLTNGENGIITAEGSSFGVIDADLSTNLAITNHGIIRSNNTDAIDFATNDTGAIFELINTGEITSGARAVDVQVGNNYIYIVNSGTMSARGLVMDLDSDAVNSSFHTVINTGVMTSVESAAIDAALGDIGTLYISNSGTITAQNVVVRTDSGRTTDVTLVNTGLLERLSQTGVAVDLGGGDDSVTNSGTIIGGIQLGQGNDTYDGRGGTLSGAVQGEGGDDTYIIDDSDIELVEAASNGTDTVEIAASYTLEANFENLTLLGSENIRGVGNGEDNIITGNAGDNFLLGRSGVDTITGGDGDDRISGGGGEDRLEGGDGNDYLSSGFGNDVVLGGGGDDVLMGRNGDDLLVGDEGNDLLIGGSGNDDLRGNDGEDMLIGGLGTDEMTGGAGADVFQFNVAADSLQGVHDTIFDFTVGEDRIDLSALFGDEILFTLNAGVFTGTGPEVRTKFNGGDTRILVDIDGDGNTDMRIDLLGISGVSVADFIL